MILAVDDNGNFLKYIPQEAGHKGRGKRHLAIAVLVCNSQGQVLLQKRKHQIFNNIWDLTAATHPLRKIDNTDETLIEATKRCLAVEWGIIGIKEIRQAGAFNYFAKYGDLCENEHCYLMLADFDGIVSLNPQMGYEYIWLDKKEFLKEIKSNPKNYTPWAIEAVKILAP